MLSVIAGMTLLRYDRAHRRDRPARLDIVVADITTLDVDAIVNAANRIAARRRRRRRRHPSRRRAGTAGGMPRRSAAATPARPRSRAATGCKASSSHPRRRAGVARRRRATRKRCWPAAIARALDLAAAHGCARSPFRRSRPASIGFPADRAARIAVGTVAAEIAAQPRGIARVVFCCFSAKAPSITGCVRGIGVGVIASPACGASRRASRSRAAARPRRDCALTRLADCALGTPRRAGHELHLRRDVQPHHPVLQPGFAAG